MESSLALQPQALALSKLLLARRQTVSCVESCTGGMLACMLTALAGSSAWFDCAYVVYTNRAKMRCVGVPAELLEQHGAVSEPVAQAMAHGGIAHSDADYCVGITGIAGPDGGSLSKPVGTVCLAWASRGGLSHVTTEHFPGDRAAVRRQSAARALQGLIQQVGDAPQQAAHV